MAIIMKRQLTDDEKERVLEIHGRVCFATGHPIPGGEPLQFDHVRAFTSGGGSYLDNIAPMCDVHNRQKGRLPLEDFRTKLQITEFFDYGDHLTLGDLLDYLKDKGKITDFGEPVNVSVDGDRVVVQAANWDSEASLYVCPVTGLRYFYISFPLNLIDSDDEENKEVGLQPRYLIFDKVFNMYRHLQRHPVLQPSIGRVDNNRIKIFDGQHKIASLLWDIRDVFECKIYLSADGIGLSDEDLRLLNDTNIAAHDKFAQTRFYSSIMVAKLGGQFGADFDKYKNLEDDEPKSEAGFMRFLATNPDEPMPKEERNKRFRSYLYRSVLDDPDNKMKQYISGSNRRTENCPLTMDMLEKSIFACFIYRKEVEDNLATDDYKRDAEISNIVALMNMLYDSALSSWNPKAGDGDDNQKRLKRLFGSKPMMAWSELLRDAVCGKALNLTDTDDWENPFYRELTEDELDAIRNIVDRLVNWNMWLSAPNSEVDRVIADNKKAVKAWLKNKGLTTGYLMGAPE